MSETAERQWALLVSMAEELMGDIEVVRTLSADQQVALLKLIAADQRAQQRPMLVDLYAIKGDTFTCVGQSVLFDRAAAVSWHDSGWDGLALTPPGKPLIVFATGRLLPMTCKVDGSCCDHCVNHTHRGYRSNDRPLPF